MDRQELESKLLTTAVMSNANTKDLIATMQSRPWIFDNKIIFDMINTVFAKANRCTESLLVSEAIKTNCIETFNKVVGQNMSKVFSHDYKKYKADLIEMTTKDKIKATNVPILPSLFLFTCIIYSTALYNLIM